MLLYGSSASYTGREPAEVFLERDTPASYVRSSLVSGTADWSDPGQLVIGFVKEALSSHYHFSEDKCGFSSNVFMADWSKLKAYTDAIRASQKEQAQESPRNQAQGRLGQQLIGTQPHVNDPIERKRLLRSEGHGVRVELRELTDNVGQEIFRKEVRASILLAHNRGDFNLRGTV